MISYDFNQKHKSKLCYYFVCDFTVLLAADVRIKDFPLMQSPVQTTVMLLGYVFLSVYVGPRLMANRKPFRLNTAMIIYNLGMVMLNAFIVFEVRVFGLLGD